MDKTQSSQCFGGNNTSGPVDMATACNAKGGAGRMDFESETFVAEFCPVAFSCKDSGLDAGELSPTLRSMGHDASHANAGGQVAVAVALRGREGGATAELGDECGGALRAGGGGDKAHVLERMAVRRLTPRECARLQGFPDDWAAITYRGKVAADGPQYKAYGNSMAVPCLRWILTRIQQVDELTKR